MTCCAEQLTGRVHLAVCLRTASSVDSNLGDQVAKPYITAWLQDPSTAATSGTFQAKHEVVDQLTQTVALPCLTASLHPGLPLARSLLFPQYVG